LEPHVIDTFAESGIWPEFGPYDDAATLARIPSIERAIGPLPVFEGPLAWQAIAAAKPREYIRVRSFRGEIVRDLVCPRHQMLGVGATVQGTSEEAWSRGDILLLQIDSDRYVHEHFIFCDMGVAQYWIRPADLAAARFDQAWATTEGG
jgi:hypothetical protein